MDRIVVQPSRSLEIICNGKNILKHEAKAIKELPNGYQYSEKHQNGQAGQPLQAQETVTDIQETSWFISNELSEGLVLFSSDEGIQIFFETAKAGYLNSYFKLSQNFLTSFEPSFSCGLATLTMCLNTFREDPCRVWKDIYRWYAQTMLEHCVPYRIIVGNGIVFQQFACMVECNYLKVALIRNAKPTASVDEFREICKKTTSGRCEEILVVCYHRRGLDQVAGGHFSPIGAYHPEKDLVLVLDISRYKYPPHWVPVERLWEAMKLHDDVTGNPRGYYVLRKRSPSEKDEVSALLFKTVSSEDSPTFHKGWVKFFNTVLMPWHNWRKSLPTPTCCDETFLVKVIRKLLELMMSSQCTGMDHLDGIHIRLAFTNADPSPHGECLVCKVRKAIETCTWWKYVREQIEEEQERKKKQYKERMQGQQHEQRQEHEQQHQEPQHNHRHYGRQQAMCRCWSKLIEDVSENKPPESMCCEVHIQPSSCHLRRFNLAHYIVMILLSWPYQLDDKNNHKISNNVCSELSSLDEALIEEVVNVRNHFLNTHSLHNKSLHKSVGRCNGQLKVAELT